MRIIFAAVFDLAWLTRPAQAAAAVEAGVEQAAPWVLLLLVREVAAVGEGEAEVEAVRAVALARTTRR